MKKGTRSGARDKDIYVNFQIVKAHEKHKQKRWDTTILQSYNWKIGTSCSQTAEIIKPNTSAKKCFCTWILMNGSEWKFLIMQKINGAMHIICHLINHYHRHRHLHHYINHSSLAQNPHYMAFHCIMVLDVGCSWPHWEKMSSLLLCEVSLTGNLLKKLSGLYQSQATVTPNRRRSNTLVWLTLINKWLDLRELLSGWIFSKSHPCPMSQFESRLLSLRRNGSTSLTNENQDTKPALTDNAQPMICFVRLNDFKWLRSFKSSDVMFEHRALNIVQE